MFQKGGHTGATHELVVEPTFVRASWSHALRRPGQKVKVHVHVAGAPDGTPVALDLRCLALTGMVTAKNPPAPSTTETGRATFEWTAGLEGEGAGERAVVLVTCKVRLGEDPLPVGYAANVLLVARFGALLESIDRCFCPATESLSVQYSIVDPSRYVRGGILRIFGNKVEGACHPDEKAIVYQRLLDPRELTEGTHTVRWEGYTTATTGPFAPAGAGSIRYVDPLYAPYVVQIQLLDRVCSSVEAWPQDDALPSLPSPLRFQGLWLKPGSGGFEPAGEGDDPVHAGFEIVYGALELALGDYVPHPDDALVSNEALCQYHLNRLGYFCGPVDGIIGNISKKGIGHFKRTHWEVDADGEPDYDKPIQDTNLANVSGDLDDATKKALFAEDRPRTFLEIVDEHQKPTRATNRLPREGEEARLILDGEVPYQEYAEFGVVVKQDREAEWIPRAWLPVVARPRLVGRTGELASADDSAYGVGTPRVLFRALEPREDHGPLGFPQGPFTELGYSTFRVTRKGTSLKEIAREFKADGFARYDPGTGAWTYDLAAIWDDPENAELKAGHPGAPDAVRLDRGERVRLPPFPEFLAYKRHREGRPETYANSIVQDQDIQDTTGDSEYDNCPSDINGTDNRGIRDRTQGQRGTECFRYGGDVWKLVPFEPAEEPDHELGKGQVVVVPGRLDAKARGRAGLFFVPSIIAGDSYRIEAVLDLSKLDKDNDHPNREALASRYPDGFPSARTGRMTVWKRVRVADYIHTVDRCAGAPRSGMLHKLKELLSGERDKVIPQLDWDIVQGHYRRAYHDVHLLGRPEGRPLTEDEYRDVVHAMYPAHARDTIAYDPAELYPSSILPYRAQGPAESAEDYLSDLDSVGENFADQFYEHGAVILRPRNRTGWVILDIRRFALPPAVIDRSGPKPRAMPARKVKAVIDKWYASAAYPKGFLLMDQRDRDRAWYTFAHEMGHGLFLYHYRYAPGPEPDQHDHPDDKFCLMSYCGPGQEAKIDPMFCGKCLLKLRGWNESAF